MNRDGKGTKVNRHLTDYCVLDLETTGIFINFAKIVEISAIKVRNNNVVDEFSTLINPQCEIPFSATEVNGITDDMVKDAPIIEDVINDLRIISNKAEPESFHYEVSGTHHTKSRTGFISEFISILSA